MVQNTHASFLLRCIAVIDMATIVPLAMTETGILPGEYNYLAFTKLDPDQGQIIHAV